jgi:O-methyltransferase
VRVAIPSVEEVVMRVSSLPNKLLSLIGLRIIRHVGSQKRYPIEISAADQRIFEYVRAHNLSTSSDERLFATIMACRHVVANDIEGDFVECGVWRGGNSVIAADVFKNLGAARAVWLFDTFAGMTPPTEFDVNYRGEPAVVKFTKSQQPNHNTWCYAPLEEVQENFKRASLLGDRVHFVAGDVADTLGKAQGLPQKISVLRLDTDWYESTKIELESLFPRLSAGGVLIIDDYGHWGGARKAVDEYFGGKSRPFFQYIDPTARIAVKCA